MPGRHVLGHPIRKAANEFSGLLRGSMRATGIDLAELARRSGRSVSGIRNWTHSASLPSYTVAAELATILDEPRLVAVVRRARTRPCDICGDPVLSEHMGAPRLFCSDSCQMINKKRFGPDTQRKAAHFQRVAEEARSMLSDHRSAVASFCRACEPEGFCRNTNCALRPVSPLPLARGVVA